MYPDAEVYKLNAKSLRAYRFLQQEVLLKGLQKHRWIKIALWF